MTEIKCTNCGKKLAEANVQQGELRIKCKCGTVNIVKAVLEGDKEKWEWLKELPISFTEKVSRSISKK
jgi:phage FluMu protein Com